MPPFVAPLIDFDIYEPHPEVEDLIGQVCDFMKHDEGISSHEIRAALWIAYQRGLAHGR